jgi:colicin import membrane protein
MKRDNRARIEALRQVEIQQEEEAIQAETQRQEEAIQDENFYMQRFQPAMASGEDYLIEEENRRTEEMMRDLGLLPYDDDPQKEDEYDEDYMQAGAPEPRAQARPQQMQADKGAESRNAAAQQLSKKAAAAALKKANEEMEKQRKEEQRERDRERERQRKVTEARLREEQEDLKTIMGAAAGPKKANTSETKQQKKERERLQKEKEDAEALDAAFKEAKEREAVAQTPRPPPKEFTVPQEWLTKPRLTAV